MLPSACVPLCVCLRAVAPTTSMIALGLFGAMNGNMVGCEWMWGIGCILLVTFGYMMPGVKVPLPGGSKYPR